MPISLTEFKRHTEYFKALDKAGVKFSIKIHNSGYYDDDSQMAFYPLFNEVRDLPALAKICELTNYPVTNTNVTLVPEIGRYIDRYSNEGVSVVSTLSKEHQSEAGSNVRFYPEEVFQDINGLTIIHIDEAPPEETIDGRTYRYLKGTADNCIASKTRRFTSVNFTVSDQHPAYNYLDKGHTVVFYAGESAEETHMLVFNQMGLDTSYILAAFVTNPKVIKGNVVNDIFVNARDARITALKLEKALNVKGQALYKRYKASILANFESNAQNMLVNKFYQNEIKEVTLNNIKISENKASYETISIEAVGLAKVILDNIDPNSEFDIYTILNVYVTHILNDIATTGTSGSAFIEDKEFRMIINGFPVIVSISSTNTRRRVNGFVINTAEVEKVVRRAACYTDGVSYNNFVRSVSRMSLECHDVLSNGLPVKVHVFGHRDYQKPVTSAHPKLKFVKDGTQVKLYLNKEKTESVVIKRFIGFIRDIQMLNRKTNGYQDYTVNPVVLKDTTWCQTQLKELVRNHVVETKGAIRPTDEQLTTFINDLLSERTEAEKRSIELLESVVKETGAEETTFNNMQGYKLKGKLRNYFVEKSTNKVFNADKGNYICIVDGRGDMGVGYDALVARLLALSNDQFTVKSIGTLRHG